MSRMGSNVLFISSKWKKNSVAETLSKSHIRCIYDDNLAPLDFKFNLTGLCYVAKLDLDADLRQYLIEIKKKLEKIHKTYASGWCLQALIDSSNRDLFTRVQELCLLEHNIQPVPVENLKEVAQYVERLIANECQEDDKNPFMKDLDKNESTSSHYLACLKSVPKIGDKNARLLVKSYSSLKSISNASLDELASKLGSSSAAKSLYDFFHV